MTETSQQPDRAEEPYERTDGPVHTWFELSYANFLVWHRAHMQSMPLEWQERFVELAEELDAAYPDGSGVGYEVTTVRFEEIGGLSEAEMETLGIGYSDDEGPGDRHEEYYLKDGTAVPRWHQVGIPVPDPVPHYRHAYLPPDEAGIAAHRRFREQMRAEDAAEADGQERR